VAKCIYAVDIRRHSGSALETDARISTAAVDELGGGRTEEANKSVARRRTASSSTSIGSSAGSGIVSDSSGFKKMRMAKLQIEIIAGFVIKTDYPLSENENEKVFINVWQHQRDEATLRRHLRVEERPIVLFGEVAFTHDKEGTASLLYNVAVSSEHFPFVHIGQTVQMGRDSPHEKITDDAYCRHVRTSVLIVYTDIPLNWFLVAVMSTLTAALVDH
jgi:hypothetical protein